MRPSFLFLSALLFACNGNDDGDDTNGGDDTDTSDTDTGGGDTDTDVNNTWSGADNGYDAPSRAPDQVINGNLVEGSVQSSLYWMDHSPYYCGTNFEQSFTGAHVHYSYDQVPLTDLIVRLVPDQGLDMSVNLLQRSAGSDALPSDSNNVIAGSGECTAMYEEDGNPSQPEVSCVPAATGQSYSTLITVAGADGLTVGSYRLEIWEEAFTGCPP